jgi:SAM-dependent methyltransferase
MILDDRPRVVFARFVRAMEAAGVSDVDRVARVAWSTVEYLKGSRADRDRLRDLRDLERYWYENLEQGRVAYDVYESPLYVAEAWACWAFYSRAYLRNLRRAPVIEPASVSSVLDLGCGIGLTTSALASLYPRARVIGTNVEGSLQMRVAEYLRGQQDYQLEAAPTGTADVVFASEYFEHFQRPVEHLEEILDQSKPAWLIFANTFNSPSTGHFPQYQHGARVLSGRQTSRLFGDTLRRCGYQKVDTGFWNNRPAVWRRAV